MDVKSEREFILRGGVSPSQYPLIVQKLVKQYGSAEPVIKYVQVVTAVVMVGRKQLAFVACPQHSASPCSLFAGLNSVLVCRVQRTLRGSGGEHGVWAAGPQWRGQDHVDRGDHRPASTHRRYVLAIARFYSFHSVMHQSSSSPSSRACV